MSMSMSSSFVLGHSFVIRHSCFVIFTLLISDLGPRKVTPALLLRRSVRVQLVVNFSDLIKGALKP